MPPKRYRLKLPHPYAKAGTIIEKLVEGYSWVEMKIPTDEKPEGFIICHFPRSVVLDWLEEVKEEPRCSKEFAEALSDAISTGVIPLRLGDSVVADWNKLKMWLDSHTSTEE
jgi:hypothetical protein